MLEIGAILGYTAFAVVCTRLGYLVGIRLGEERLMKRIRSEMTTQATAMANLPNFGYGIPPASQPLPPPPIGFRN